MSKSVAVAPSGFDHFGLDESLTRGVRALGFDSPRSIQADTIPAAMAGQDVLGLAQTGTGKTAAFALPILDRMLKIPVTGSPRVLVLAPTRELATQITHEFSALAKFTRLKLATIYGGVSVRSQAAALRRKPEIVVGCPGRVLDLVEQGILRLDRVEVLVLDEADHMFDMGFLPGIRKILRALPTRRQNLLFSATMPGEVRHLANEILKKPHVVELADAAPAETIDHALVMVNEKQKGELLEHFLREDTCKTAIVFTRTKHRARRLAERLDRAGHRAVALQGNMSQPQRDRAMRGFRTGQFSVLVATDIVARGIDVSNVSHVINYDVPTTPEAYTHRIGRTGRAERDGVARTFVTGEDHAWVRATERMIGSAIQRYEVSGFQTDFRVPEAPKVVEASAPRTTYGSRSRRRTRNRRFGSGNRSRSGRPSA